MAEAEFGLGVELGHGLVLLGEIKEGVVAEAECSTWSILDLALDCAVGCGDDLAVAGCGEDAVVSGEVRAGDFAEGFEHAEVVSREGLARRRWP